MFVRNKRSLCVLGLLLTAGLLLSLVASWANAANQVKNQAFKLTKGDFTTVAFTPTQPGQVSITATWESVVLGVEVKKDVSMKVELLLPDGKAAEKPIVAGSPLQLKHTISSEQFAQFQGKAYQVKISNTVTGAKKDQRNVEGSVKINFPVKDVPAPIVLVDTEKDALAGDGAQTDISFQLKKDKTGALKVTVDFRDRVKDRPLEAQLIRGDGSAGSKVIKGDAPLVINDPISAADLATGLNWKVRLQNKNNVTLRGISVKAVLQPAN